MLKLPEFQYHQPSHLAGVLELTARYGQSARIVAGGTDLLPSMKQRLFLPEHVVSLRGILSLRHVEGTAQAGVRIGSMVTLREIANSPLIQQHYPALASAAGQVATVIIQGMATIGGNILLDTRCYYYNQGEFWREALGKCMKADGTICQVARSSPKCLAAFSADTVPTLMLYGATVVFEGHNGRREVSLNAFYQDDGMHWAKLLPGEVLTEVLLPPPVQGLEARYDKVRLRQAIDYPLLGVGVGLKRAPDGTVESLRILLNAVSSMPEEVPETAQLVGSPLSDEGIELVSLAAYMQVKPLTTHGVQPVYRKKMVKVTVRRALQELMLAGSSQLNV